MNEFSKYEGSEYIICFNTVDVTVKSMIGGDFTYTFNKGTKYKCRVYTDIDNGDERGFIYIENKDGEILFNTWDRDDVKSITENFNTIAEHRKLVIETL